MAQGLRITLTALDDGLTVDLKGNPVLPQPFVLQCPPMDEHKVVHQFNQGNYDTIEQGQFVRWGSRQLMTWQFDTLVMYLADNTPARSAYTTAQGMLRQAQQAVIAARSGSAQAQAAAAAYYRQVFAAYEAEASLSAVPGSMVVPTWVPFSNGQRPQWYVDQLRALHDSGAPFRYVASFDGVADEVLRTKALLIGFSEGHKAGEGDAIYLEGVSFQEWRDPSILELHHNKPAKKRRGASKLPTTVKLLPASQGSVAEWGPHHKHIPTGGDTTLAQLAKFFYGDPQDWHLIVRANNIRGAAPNALLTSLHPFAGRTTASTVRIPALPHPRHRDKESTGGAALRP